MTITLAFNSNINATVQGISQQLGNELDTAGHGVGYPRNGVVSNPIMTVQAPPPGFDQAKTGSFESNAVTMNQNYNL